MPIWKGHFVLRDSSFGVRILLKNLTKGRTIFSDKAGIVTLWEKSDRLLRLAQTGVLLISNLHNVGHFSKNRVIPRYLKKAGKSP